MSKTFCGFCGIQLHPTGGTVHTPACIYSITFANPGGPTAPGGAHVPKAQEVRPKFAFTGGPAGLEPPPQNHAEYPICQAWDPSAGKFETVVPSAQDEGQGPDPNLGLPQLLKTLRAENLNLTRKVRDYFLLAREVMSRDEAQRKLISAYSEMTEADRIFRSALVESLQRLFDYVNLDRK